MIGCTSRLKYSSLEGIIVTATEPATFSLREAAALARLSEDKVRREVEYRVIEPATIWVGRAPRRVFSEPEVHYLTFIALLNGDIDLSRPVRARIYQTFLSRSYGGTSVVRIMPLDQDDVEWTNFNRVVTFNYDAAVEAAACRIELYRRGKERIASSEAVLGGEPVFAGTRLSVRHVGGMRLNGEPVDRILEDYPYLTGEDIEFAAVYAQANPPLGRPKATDPAP